MSTTVKPVSGPVSNAQLALGQRAIHPLIMFGLVVASLNPF
jgi:hypothetical protein